MQEDDLIIALKSTDLDHVSPSVCSARDSERSNDRVLGINIFSIDICAPKSLITHSFRLSVLQ